MVTTTRPAATSALCEKALSENDPSLTEQRITWGRESSWDSRVAQMENILKNAGLWD
ncbi:MAG: hypothetical protein IKZ19_03525 [Clostridia bacterium]|nr:hypothetical protein [Clostridia bacterium]